LPLLIALTVDIGRADDGALAIGWTRDRAIEWLGPPEAQVSRRGRTTLFYGHDEVVLAHDVVVSFTPGIKPKADRARERKQRLAAQAAAAPRASHAVPQRAAPAAQKIKTVSNRGQRVDLTSLLVPGKVTVIDFYADWCGPCRRLAPRIEALVRSDPDLYLRKVDIVKWKTPVTRQHNIRSVPQLWVFDGNGRQVGRPTSKLKLVQDYIRQAKQ
jgi:thioredoxin 1